MKVYIAGPMSGIPKFNYPAFNTAEGQLFVAGFMPPQPGPLRGAQHDREAPVVGLVHAPRTADGRRS